MVSCAPTFFIASIITGLMCGDALGLNIKFPVILETKQVKKYSSRSQIISYMLMISQLVITVIGRSIMLVKLSRKMIISRQNENSLRDKVKNTAVHPDKKRQPKLLTLWTDHFQVLRLT